MEEEREEGSVGRGLQDPLPGSPEMPQLSARLPALDAAPAHPGEPVGVHGAPVKPGTPASSAQPPRCPPLRSGQPGPRSPCRRLPALGCSAGPRQLHAPPPAPHRCRRALRLTSASPAETPLSTERVPAGRGALLRPWGRESWEEWEGSPEGREGAPPSWLGRRELHAAGARRDCGSRVDAAPRVCRLAVSAPSEIGFSNPIKGRASALDSGPASCPEEGGHCAQPRT